MGADPTLTRDTTQPFDSRQALLPWPLVNKIFASWTLRRTLCIAISRVTWGMQGASLLPSALLQHYSAPGVYQTMDGEPSDLYSFMFSVPAVR